jgi:hypothetical protein
MMQDSVSASIEVPLLLHKEDRQDAMLQETYAMQQNTEDQLAELPNQLREQLYTLQSELDMHGELVRRYGTALVPQARLSVESMLAAYASGMMPLDDVFMALDRALATENEYEQQQIHYVHVLADLQVATAGVFDPAPHMAAAALPAPSGGSIGDAVGGLAVAPPAEEGLQLPQVPFDPAETSGPSADDDATAPPFVDNLALPLPAAGEPVGQDEPPETSDFYAPFIPGTARQDPADKEKQHE